MAFIFLLIPAHGHSISSDKRGEEAKWHKPASEASHYACLRVHETDGLN